MVWLMVFVSRRCLPFPKSRSGSWCGGNFFLLGKKVGGKSCRDMKFISLCNILTFISINVSDSEHIGIDKKKGQYKLYKLSFYRNSKTEFLCFHSGIWENIIACRLSKFCITGEQHDKDFFYYLYHCKDGVTSLIQPDKFRPEAHAIMNS